MKVIKIDKNDWAEGLERSSKTFRLFGPAKQDEFHIFKELGKGELPDLNLQNTRLSPRSVVYPQSEKMFEFTLDENQEDHHILKEIQKDYSPRAVIGIRPCDAKAFLLVKRNFDTPEYKDPYWIKSYEATTLVGHACNAPAAPVFAPPPAAVRFMRKGWTCFWWMSTIIIWPRSLRKKEKSFLQLPAGIQKQMPMLQAIRSKP